MGEKIGGISLDDIMAAATGDLEAEEIDRDEENAKAAEEEKSQTGVGEKKVGGVSMDAILAAAMTNMDDGSDVLQKKNGETVGEAVPAAAQGQEPDVRAQLQAAVADDAAGADGAVDVKPHDKTEVQHRTAAWRAFPIFDVFARAVETKNWGLIIWLIINLIVVALIFSFAGPVGAAVGIIVYALSLVVALSPLGEAILRFENGCHPVKDKNDADRLQNIFARVYAKAREAEPGISPDIRLFICNEQSENAFATGRRTICVTQGLLRMSDEQIEAILAHEFGHLAHRDTDNLLLVVIGNLIVTVALLLFSTFVSIFTLVFDALEGNKDKGITRVARFLSMTLLMGIWTKLGAALCLRGNRMAEFAADRFAAELGYAKELIDSFAAMEKGPGPRGLWATLMSTHPATPERIMRLQEAA